MNLLEKVARTVQLEAEARTWRDGPEGRRVKIETPNGVRELTQRELILLLARRAAVESDVQAGKKPRFKKCFAAGCVLLIAIKKYGTCTKWCPVHKREAVKSHQRKHNLSAKRIEKRRIAQKKYRKNWMPEQREKQNKAQRKYVAAMTPEQREKQREKQRVRMREWLAAMTPEQHQKHLEERRRKRAAKKCA